MLKRMNFSEPLVGKIKRTNHEAMSARLTHMVMKRSGAGGICFSYRGLCPAIRRDYPWIFQKMTILSALLPHLSVFQKTPILSALLPYPWIFQKTPILSALLPYPWIFQKTPILSTLGQQRSAVAKRKRRPRHAVINVFCIVVALRVRHAGPGAGRTSSCHAGKT
jgi:hypothetical protein